MRLFIYFIPILALILLISCENESPSNQVPFTIQLTDDPGDYQQVNIDLMQVRIRYRDEETFVDVETQWGIYDLLQLQNGIDTLIVNDTIPSGEIDRIWLVLGPNSTVMVDSVLHELKTPSAEQSGLKISLNRSVLSSDFNEITLDFDAGESVVDKGNGGYSLKPLIRVLE